MTAGNKYEYRWADGVKVKRPIECSAPDYVHYLMDWVERQLDDENVRLPLSLLRQDFSLFRRQI